MLKVLETVGLGCKAVWNTLLAGRLLATAIFVD